MSITKKRVQFNVVTAEDNEEKNVIISDFYVSDLESRTFTKLDPEEEEVIRNEFTRENNTLLVARVNMSNGDISCNLGEVLVKNLENANETSCRNTKQVILDLVKRTLDTIESKK